MLSEVQSYLSKTVTICFKFLFFLIIIRFFIIEPGRVNGQSMEKTMRDDELFLVNKQIYFFHEPRRFELIQFFHPQVENELIVKRVIGLPGETISLKRNGIFIKEIGGHEIKIQEPYLKPDAVTSVFPGQIREISIPANTYFVLGDNRLFSKDSRDFGPIHRQYVNGKIITL